MNDLVHIKLKFELFSLMLMLLFLADGHVPLQRQIGVSDWMVVVVVVVVVVRACRVAGDESTMAAHRGRDPLHSAC